MLFLPWGVKWAIEKGATAVVGARVNLDKAHVTLRPLGITLYRLQVTDRQAPMTNLFEVQRIAFGLEPLELLRRKVIIEEMALEGVRVNTPRRSSGAIVREHGSSQRATTGVHLPGVNLPSVDQLLAREKLSSLQQITVAQQQMATLRQSWQERLATLPDKKKIEAYQQRLKELQGKGGDLAGRLATAEKLASDIRADLANVSAARNDFSADLSRMQQLSRDAARAPMDDVRRLTARYGLSPTGMANITGMILGERINGWVYRGISWYQRLQPLVERQKKQAGNVTAVQPLRGKGVSVRFPERQPLPDFLIKHITVSVVPTAGTVQGTIHDITPDQDILGRPLTFAIGGAGLPGVQRFAAEGEINRISSSHPIDTIALRLNGIDVSNVSLVEGGDLPLALQKGKADLMLTGTRRGEKIEARLVATLHGVHIGGPTSEGRSPVAGAVSSALSTVDHFTVTVDITGRVDDFQLQIHSDLDRLLATAVTGALKQTAARFEQELTTAVTAQTKGGLAAIDGNLGELHAMDSALAGSKGELTALLKKAASPAMGGIRLPF
jgi:uncharacterized protein (TIGR03545 family)